MIRTTSLVILAALTMPATADPTHSFLALDNHVYVGAYAQTLESSLTAQRDGFDPVTVDVDDLGIDDRHTSWLFEYRHRFNNAWSVNFAAYEFSNERRSRAESDFNYDGVDFAAGVGINSELTIRTYILDAMYSVYRTDSTEVDIGAGIHLLDNEASIQLIAGVDGELVAETEQARATVLAPLPNVRASVFHAFNDDWSVHATMGWLSAKIYNIDGDFAYLNIRGQYQFSEHWGLSLGYKFLEVDVVESLDNGLNGFDLSFDGVTAAISYDF